MTPSRLARGAMLALLLAASVSARAQSVALVGPPLPKGTVLRFDAVLTTESEIDVADGEALVPSARVTRSVDREEVVRADARGVHAVRRHTLADSTWERMGDLPVTVEVGDRQGRSVLLERGTDGIWRRRADGWDPTPEQAARLRDPVPERDAELPRKALRVGETVDVPAEAIVRAYGALAPDTPAWMTVRLDSVGTAGGHRVAYLTEETEVTVLAGGGVWIEMAMTGRLVRRIDQGLTVRTEWEGETVAYLPDGASLIASWMTLVEDVVVEAGPLAP